MLRTSNVDDKARRAYTRVVEYAFHDACDWRFGNIVQPDLETTLSGSCEIESEKLAYPESSVPLKHEIEFCFFCLFTI